MDDGTAHQAMNPYSSETVVHVISETLDGGGQVITELLDGKTIVKALTFCCSASLQPHHHGILVPTHVLIAGASQEAKAFRSGSGTWKCEQRSKCRQNAGTGDLDVSGSRLG
jgi:hypothetical protein